MTMPTTVYRLQFRDGMDFDRAAELVPYLAGLGVSHLYASPLFTAATGSTHGYDVTDPAEIDPALGGREGLERLSKALKAAGLGLILDTVPNHMAFSPEAPWLRDLLRHGKHSRYARHFDLDPASDRLRLPWLDGPFEAFCADGAFRVERDEDGPVLTNGGLRVPLSDTPSLDAARGDPSPDAIRALHDEQPWRLVDWRTESDVISHRRFFNITGLIGVRVEDDAVFDDSHALLIDLVKSGIVDGIRIDHVDGLADPAGYLDRLHERLPDTPVWVEKILTGDEALAPWPVAGTTGYVAARVLGRALTDAGGRSRLEAVYRERTGRTQPLHEALAEAKRQILTHDLAAELWQLHARFAELAASDPVAAEFGPETLRNALIEMIAAFPRYRTYMTAGHIGEEDAALIRDTAARAASALPHPGALPHLARTLLSDTPGAAGFRLRFQQVTGAAMAKAQEDTLFYRDVALLAANEVGGEPDDAPLDAEGFHEAMMRRQKSMPQGLTLMSSHDTKRSADARMRMIAATHAPDAFLDFVDASADPAPDGVSQNLHWYLAQSLLAIAGSGDVAARLSAHVEKALREAKEVTFWTAPDEAVETAARDHATRLAETFGDGARIPDDLLRMSDRLVLAQTALGFTVPGIPDLYQGCEVARYMLTDPENRRPVDFGRLAAALDDPGHLDDALDRAKFALTHRLVQARKAEPALFLEGDYRPEPAPEGALAFTRRKGERWLWVGLSLTGTAPERPEGRVLWPQGAQDGLAVVLAD